MGDGDRHEFYEEKLYEANLRGKVEEYLKGKQHTHA